LLPLNRRIILAGGLSPDNEIAAAQPAQPMEPELAGSVEALLAEEALPNLFSEALDDLWTE